LALREGSLAGKQNEERGQKDGQGCSEAYHGVAGEKHVGSLEIDPSAGKLNWPRFHTRTG